MFCKFVLYLIFVVFLFFYCIFVHVFLLIKNTEQENQIFFITLVEFFIFLKAKD